MKRGRVSDDCPIVDMIDGRTLCFLLFPYLSAVDAAKLRGTCHYFKAHVDTEPRFVLHLMQINHPSEIDYTDLEPASHESDAYEGMDVLHDHGYVGEGRTLCKDARTGRFVLYNDFYGLGFRSLGHWLGFVKHLQADKEFDFRWRFIEFPTLGGRERYVTIGPNYTVHRGSCVWISWKAL